MTRPINLKKFFNKLLIAVAKYLSQMFLRGKFKGPIQSDQISKILYICLGERGDIIITSAAIQRIKNLNQSCEIYYLSQKKYNDVARCLEGISFFIGVDLDKKNILFQLNQFMRMIIILRECKFDLVIDDPGIFHSFILWIFSKSKYVVASDQHGFGVLATNSVKYSEGYNILDRRKYLTDFFCNDNFIFRPNLGIATILKCINSDFKIPLNRYVTFQPIAGWRGKCIDSRLANYIVDLIFHKYGLDIVVLGGAEDYFKVFGDQCKPHVFDLTGKTTAAESMALVYNSHLHIGGDSFLRHVATSFDTPSITIYGSTNHLFSGYFDNRHRAFFHDIPCRPITSQYCSLNAGRACPHLSCISDLSLENFSLLLDEFIHLEPL